MHTHDCKHLCGGVRDEQTHLPCLKEDCAKPGDPEADDYCNICWVEDLASAPCILLTCGHIFHHACIKTRIDRGYESLCFNLLFGTITDCELSISIIYILQIFKLSSVRQTSGTSSVEHKRNSRPGADGTRFRETKT